MTDHAAYDRSDSRDCLNEAHCGRDVPSEWNARWSHVQGHGKWPRSSPLATVTRRKVERTATEVEDDTTDNGGDCFDLWNNLNETLSGCDVTSGWNASWCRVQDGVQCRCEGSLASFGKHECESDSGSSSEMNVIVREDSR